MGDFRGRLRVETKEIHDRLEEVYPFKQLVEATCDAKALDDVIYCFYLKFNALVELKANDEGFYYAMNEVFKKYRTSSKNMRSISHLDLLSLEYLMLGSRMGNNLILKKNPEIIKLSGSEYLEIAFPSKIWKELLLNILEIETKESQDDFITKVIDHYKDLISIGKKLHT